MTPNSPHPCCSDLPNGSTPSLAHTPVPAITQYASAELIEAIAYKAHDPADDLRWAESGAPSQEVYGRWCRHLCGMACLQMALIHRDGTTPSLFQLLGGAHKAGAYTTTGDEIKGLNYAPFVDYVRDEHGLTAVVHGHLSMDGLLLLLGTGRMVMASVAKGIRTPDLTPERRGGHLVLVCGVTSEGHIAFNNPSGHTPQSREAVLAPDLFERYFAGRGVSLDLRPLPVASPLPTTAERATA